MMDDSILMRIYCCCRVSLITGTLLLRCLWAYMYIGFTIAHENLFSEGKSRRFSGSQRSKELGNNFRSPTFVNPHLGRYNCLELDGNSGTMYSYNHQ